MKQWLRRFLEAIGWIPATEYIALPSDDHPDQASLPHGIVHIVGGRDYQKWAYLRCPCRCGAVIMLSLAASRRPRWRARTDWFGRPTLAPSVWQTAGCYSHFFLRDGRVDWVRDTGTPPPRAYFDA